MARGDIQIASVSLAAQKPTGYSDGMAIAAGTAYVSPVMTNDGQTTVAVGAILSTNGTLSVQRFVDSGGTIKQGSPLTATLTANQDNAITVGEGAPWLSYQITITPSGGSAATLTKLACTLRATEAYSGSASLPFGLDLLLAEMRVHSLALYELINRPDSLATIRQDQLTEMGSLATKGLGS